jgi:hypothetical protein
MSERSRWLLPVLLSLLFVYQAVSTMVPAGIIDAVTLKGMSECRAARYARQLAP